MDEAVKVKLLELLRLVYGGEVAKVGAHLRTLQAAPAGTEFPAEYGRRVTSDEVEVDVIPSVAAPHGGNAVVQFAISVRAAVGEAFGTVDCEAAFETMDRWQVTKMELLVPTPDPDAFSAAVLGIDVEASKVTSMGGGDSPSAA